MNLMTYKVLVLNYIVFKKCLVVYLNYTIVMHIWLFKKVLDSFVSSRAFIQVQELLFWAILTDIPTPCK